MLILNRAVGPNARCDNGSRRLQTALDTVRNSGAAIGSAGKIHTGKRCHGLLNFGDALFVSDINGDFHIGAQKFPDGFMVTIKIKKP